jgi:hypothetical protein
MLLLGLSLSIKAQLKIYGGKNHDQFLGCMTCDGEKPYSIWSPLSDFGSTHNPKSIWNERGKYGSVTSDYSPYNVKAKYPPSIVDGNGKFKGYLTINKNYPNRLNGALVDLIVEKREVVLKDGVETYAHLFKPVN